MTINRHDSGHTWRLLWIPGLVTIVLSISAGCSGSSASTSQNAGREIQIESGTVDLVVAQLELTRSFARLVQLSGIASSMDANARYTMFAPIDDAVAQYLVAKGMSIEQLEADGALMTAFVGAHIIVGEYSGTNLLNAVGTSIDSISNQHLSIRQIDGNVAISGVDESPAKLIAIDLQATNGLVHIIDGVLAP
jgi:uncharacterized surface protein with fasciclin (FAS1) repeats